MGQRAGLLTTSVILLVGLILGVATYTVAVAYEGERVQARFREILSDRTGQVEKEISVLREILHATRALFDSSETVTREEFGSFTRPALARHRGIRAVEWIPLIRAGEREGHERSMREEGRDDYHIRSLREEEFD